VVDQAYVLPILDDSQVFVTRPGTTGLQLTDGALPLFSTVSVS
jgi:peptide/nickel transport system substrate-binding protein